MRYWDGTQWTSHTAPGTPAPTGRSGVKVGVILAIVAVVVVLAIGALAAMAIPVYLNQQSLARDAAAKSDLAQLRVDVLNYWVENFSGPAPTLAMEGDQYVLVTPQGTEILDTASPGVTFRESDIRTIDDWCISVSVEGGNVGEFHATGDATTSILDGPCP